MANMYISEYAPTNTAQIAAEPSLETQKIAFTTSTASAAFTDRTKIICVQLDGDGHISVGANPTATTNDRKLIAGSDYYLAVTAGNKIAAIITA